MNDRDLCQLLEQLRNEIEGTQSVDEKERHLLHELNDDIRELLERCDQAQPESEALTLSRFEDAIESMATNHPLLANLLSHVLNTLSNAGV